MIGRKNLSTLATCGLFSLTLFTMANAQPCPQGQIRVQGKCKPDPSKSKAVVKNSPYIPDEISFTLNQKTTIQLDSTKKKERNGQAEILRSANNISVKVSGLKSADGEYTVFAVNKGERESTLTPLGSMQVKGGAGVLASNEKLSSFGIMIVQGKGFNEARLVVKSTVVK